MSETDFWREVREVAREALRDELYRPTGITPGVHNGITFDRYGKATFAGLSAGGAALERATTLTVTPGASGTITYGTADVIYNDGSAFWGTTNPTRILIPSTGRYIVTQFIYGGPATAGTTNVTVTLHYSGASNPALGLAHINRDINQNFIFSDSMAVVWELAANTYVDTIIANNGGYAAGTPNMSIYNTHISIQRVT